MSSKYLIRVTNFPELVVSFDETFHFKLKQSSCYYHDYYYCYYTGARSLFRQAIRTFSGLKKWTLFVRHCPVSELEAELRPPLQPPNKFTARTLSQSLMEDTQTPPPACASQSTNQATRAAMRHRGGWDFCFCSVSLYMSVWAAGHVIYNARWLTRLFVKVVSDLPHSPSPTPKHGPPLWKVSLKKKTLFLLRKSQSLTVKRSHWHQKNR